jgi:hypothetical protein
LSLQLPAIKDDEVMRRMLLVAVSCLEMLNCDGLAAQTQWRLRENLRIGSINQVNYSLGEVQRIAVDATGRMAVTQPRSFEVRMFSSDGRYIRTIGKQGSGPGEFRRVGGVGFRGDTLWVADAALSRITMFSPAGEVLNTLTVTGPSVEGSIRPSIPYAITSDGSLLGEVIAGDSSRVYMIPLVRMNRSGGMIGTFGNVRIHPGIKVTAELNGQPLVVSSAGPIQQRGLWDPAPNNGEVVIVDRPAPTSNARSTFRVQRFSASGAMVLDVSIPYSPKEIPAATRDSLYSTGLNTSELSFALPPTINEEYVRQLRAFRYDVPVTNLVVGRDGTIWLRRESLGLRNVQWLILDPQGRQIGQITTPAGLTILEAERDQVWGVIKDELEVPYVVRYSVTS